MRLSPMAKVATALVPASPRVRHACCASRVVVAVIPHLTRRLPHWRVHRRAGGAAHAIGGSRGSCPRCRTQGRFGNESCAVARTDEGVVACVRLLATGCALSLSCCMQAVVQKKQLKQKEEQMMKMCDAMYELEQQVGGMQMRPLSTWLTSVCRARRGCACDSRSRHSAAPPLTTIPNNSRSR